MIANTVVNQSVFHFFKIKFTWRKVNLNNNSVSLTIIFLCSSCMHGYWRKSWQTTEEVFIAIKIATGKLMFCWHDLLLAAVCWRESVFASKFKTFIREVCGKDSRLHCWCLLQFCSKLDTNSSLLPPSVMSNLHRHLRNKSRVSDVMVMVSYYYSSGVQVTEW